MATVDELLTVLRRRREARGGELTAALGVSQPTLSRLMAAAGDRVCRMGRARATRYALTRSIPTLGTRLPVRRVDETGRVHPYGTIHLLAGGRHWLERADGTGELFEGLPPFAWDMSPQGFIGRNFPALHSDLGLPRRISDWSDDDRLVALARRGEDCAGDLIIGDESFDRFLASTLEAVGRAAYPDLARRSLEGHPPGSSAAGEQPKFAIHSEGRQVLVKFAGGEPGPVTQRWQDLLLCEREALEVIRGAGIPAASAHLLDVEGIRFLEVERFDRVGARGRKGLISLYALGIEHLGYLDDWTRAAGDLVAEGRIGAEDAQTSRWLDAFGDLIGNSDRHFGNVSFFVEGAGRLRLAPAYDMLPMLFAPQGTTLLERGLEPSPPTAATFDVWPDAAHHALDYWARLAELPELNSGFRELCSRCREAVEAAVRRAPGI